MAVRSSVADVKVVIDTTLTDPQVQAYLEDASLWVDEELDTSDYDLSANRLERIEKYLTCHLVTLQDPRLKQARADDVAETWQRDEEVTEYLKSAIALDPTGKVQDAFKPREGAFRAFFRVADGFSD